MTQPVGFTCLPLAGAPFSLGVAAVEGFALRRVCLRRALPLGEGFALVAESLRAAGLEPSAAAACELRVPKRLSVEEFRELNGQYRAALVARGMDAGGAFSMARTAMAPAVDAPVETVLAAFTFAVPCAGAGGDFVISGVPELGADGVVAAGDVSPAGMVAKAEFVVGELRRRVDALRCRWDAVTAAQVYTRRPMSSVMELLLGNRLGGAVLVEGDPPVVGPGGVGLEFEMDVRAVSSEETV